MILAVLTFVLFFAAIWGTYWVLVVRPEQAEAGAFVGRLKGARGARTALQRTIARKPAQRSRVRAFDTLLTRGDAATESLQLLITQSGVRINLGTLVIASAVLAVLAFVVLFGLFSAVGTTVVVVLVALAGAGLVALVPIAVLKFMRGRRLQKFEEQFPEALDLLSRALRAGHAFTTGYRDGGR